MKKLLLTMVCAGAVTVSAFAQLLDEKNVTITMDLQPVLQLSLQGPDQIDFTFDNINAYMAGITKYGANILRVSASVSFDLWAAGLSQGNVSSQMWDQVIDYPGGSGALTTNEIPISALELRQFPANPSVTDLSTCGGGVMTSADDYSSNFSIYQASTPAFPFAADVSNNIYAPASATPYTQPATVGGTPTDTEKMIAGAGQDNAAGCQVAGGSYLNQTIAGGTFSADGYMFVMDYRLLPGLPAVFPAHKGDIAANGTTTNGPVNDNTTTADNIETTTALGDGATVDDAIYAAPGVYTMYIKYILTEDQ